MDSYQTKYLRSLPLHSSQEEIETTPEYSVFRIRVRPTYDFERALLSYGATLEVLKPLSLRERIAKEIREMVNHYLSDK